MKQLFKRFNSSDDRVWALGVALLAWAGYAATAVRGIYPRDNAELITAAYTLGIAHPPAYPLYVLLGKLFTIVIPLGSVAYRVNVMSGFFAAASLGVLYLVLRALGVSRLASTLTAALLGVSRLFWFYAVIADVFSLNTFLALTLFLLFVYWSQTRDNRYVYAGAALLGAAFGNHHTIIWVVPALVVAIFLTDKKIFFSWTMVKAAAISLGTLILLYTFVYLRSRMNPVLDWGDPQTLGHLRDVFFRREFGTFSLSKNFENPAALYGRLAYGQFYVQSLLSQFHWWGLLLAAAGCGWFWRHGRTMLWAVIVFVLGAGPVMVWLISGVPISDNVKFVSEKFFILSAAGIAILIGAGLQLLYDLARRRAQLFSAATLAISLLLGTIILGTAASSARTTNLASYRLDQQFINDILDSIELNGLLITPNDSIVFGIWYVQNVEGRRQDVAVFHPIDSVIGLEQFRSRHPDLFNQPTTTDAIMNKILFGDQPPPTELGRVIRELTIDNLGRRPIYYSVGDPALTTGLIDYLRPHGLVYQLTDSYNTVTSTTMVAATQLLTGYHLPPSQTISEAHHFLDNEIALRYAIAHNDSGFYWLALGNYTEARHQFELAKHIDPTSKVTIGNINLLNRIEQLEVIRETSRGNPTIDSELAYHYFQTGQFSRSEALLVPLVKKDPTSALLLNNLAEVELKLGRWPDALRHFTAALKADPTLTNAKNRIAYLNWLID